MYITNAMQNLRARARRWLPKGGGAVRARLGLTAALLVAPLAHAEFQNGSFEQDWAGWSVESLRVADHIPTFPPTQFGHLGTRAWNPATDHSAGPGLSVVVGSTTAANTGGQLTTPLFGNKSARVGDGRNEYRGASIRQTATMQVGDIDPADKKVHIRFAVAPVLDAPTHPGDQQPYFFVEVKNLTKGTQLFNTFNFANQTGVAWQAVGSYQFTNWQAVDIAPGAGVLDVGDQVEVIIVSGGCGQSGHGGLVYVDSGQGLTTLPGPFVTATGPQYGVRSDPGADTPGIPPPAGQRTIAYNYHYTNGGDAPMVNSRIVIRSPQDQDERNASGVQVNPQQNLRVDPGSLPPGCSITSTIVPPHADGSLGSVDVVTCSVGTLNPGNAGDLSLKWIVPDDARAPTVNHGNYYIQSDATPPLLGPLVKTELTTLKLADLKATVTNASSSLACGASTAYTVTLENGGPDAAPVGAVIANAVPAGLTVGSWSCDATGNATLACPAASGAGSIAGTTTTAWPAGDKLVYTANATVAACPGGATLITYPVTVALPPADATTVDPESGNNTGAHVLNAGPALQPLNVSTIGAGLGKVTSVLPGIVCDKTGVTQCVDSKQFPQGSQVALYANAPAGSIFAGWSGGVCSGTAQPCMVTMDRARSVVAAFATPLDVTITTGPGGTATPGSGTVPVTPGGTTSITVVPNSGYAPVFGGSCPTGSLVGNTYTTGAVSSSCTVDITFTNAGGVVTATPNNPANGSIVGGPKTVVPGGSATWTVVPNSGFTPSDPTHTCPAPAAGSWNAGRTEYTVNPVNANCTVNFAFVAAHTVTGSVSGTSPGPGSITAGSSQTVASGGSAVFTLSRPGAVDAASTCTGGSFDVAGTTYTVPNVTADCAMVFSFAALPPAPVGAKGIPTLSQWGLIILSAMMGLFMWGHRRWTR